MSRVSESRVEYGVIAAGALSKSLIGQLPRKAREIGPVAGVSYRVASRMANALRAGYAARNPEELNGVPVILFHAPAAQMRQVAKLLEGAPIEWKDKSLIFCDCEVPIPILERFRALGAATAEARQFGMTGSIMVEGTAPALGRALRIASQLKLRAIEIEPGASDVFAATVTLATAALTPLVNRAAAMLRRSGLRDKAAVGVATALFERTIQEYGRSGKQSWVWHMREPEAEQIEAEIAAMEEAFRPLFRQLILAGFDEFAKHPAVALQLRGGTQTR
ncbi:MAG TPA: hypothetical protein VHA14_06900 [Bryobacteraceae bacterium]|nr:hypothetical protein [Bryobacteraceae bacterium]